MTNSIIKAIAAKLNAQFGSGYNIYTEQVEQGLLEPCFFVLSINHTDQLFLGNRYFRQNAFCIHYCPVSKDQPKEECNAVAEKLFPCLEYINADGVSIRGTKKYYEITDGILNFFVNYDSFVHKTADSVPMQDLQLKNRNKGGLND